MLERDDLLIEPWAAAAAAETARTIRALPESEALGYVVQVSAAGWLAGPAEVVREAEDMPLLMTMRRVWRWSRCWTVRDADDRLVGRIYARQMVNTRGQVVATLEGQPPDMTRFLGLDGRELASSHSRSDGTRVLHFADTPENNPFTRMLLLGAVLALS